MRDVTTSATTDEAYGAGGELLWRHTGDSNTRSFVPFKGDILAEYYSGGTLFDHSDELGSVTTSTSYNGSASQERLFYPFGELWTGAGSSGMHQTFAKLPDYDAETDQYNTLNRHYTPSGRWMSPDPGGVRVVHLDDPQTWNMYAYVRNNPTTLTDPTGLFDCAPGGGDCEVISGVLVEAKNAANSVELNSKPKEQMEQSMHETSTANVVYNETGGLVATTAKGDGSAQDLHEARVAEADVKINRDKAGIEGGMAKDDVKLDSAKSGAYKDSQAAAHEAATSPDRTGGATHAVVYFGGRGAQNWGGWIPKSKIVKIYGPFLNKAGGGGPGNPPKGAYVLVFILR